MTKLRKKTAQARPMISHDAAVELLPDVEHELTVASVRYSSAYEDALRALSACYQVMQAEGAEVVRLKARRDEMRAAIDLGPQESTVEVQTVDNPMMTNGLRDAAAKGEPATPTIEVAKDMVLLIGGYARVSGRTHEQTLAAAKFRSLHDMAQLGGARAQDYAKVKVDSFGVGEDLTTEIGADARRQYAAAVKVLGMVKSNIVEQVVVYDRSVRQLANSMGLGDSGFALRKARHELVAAVNLLVGHFEIKPGAGTEPKVRGWRDNHVPFSQMMATC